MTLILLPFQLAWAVIETIVRLFFEGFPWGTLLIILLAVTVILGGHAVAAHGQEAIDARNCLDKNGSMFVFQEKSGRLHRMCQADSGEIFDQVVEYTEKGLEEVTALKPDPWFMGNTWKNIYQWFNGKGGALFKWIDGAWRTIPLEALLEL